MEVLTNGLGIVLVNLVVSVDVFGLFERSCLASLPSYVLLRIRTGHSKI